ncbi:MAG TPA: alpha/beta hydrolase [Chryseosolibacter sp.]
MFVLKVIAGVIIALYLSGVLALYFFQTRLIFYPGKLAKDFRFRTIPLREEVFLKTEDGETINGLFFPGEDKTRAILYFHGNAGDLSGWQFVAEDLLPSGLSILIIDYRGYGKSTGSITEQGLYADAEAAFQFLQDKKKIKPNAIIVYGRSIGSGVAVDLASRKKCAGVILESSYSSLATLANEKVPFFFPSFYLRSKFNNLEKINHVKAPIAFIHGSDDTLIPPAHSHILFETFQGKKTYVLVEKGQHNDLHAFPQFKDFIKTNLTSFFFGARGYQLSDN